LTVRLRDFSDAGQGFGVASPIEDCAFDFQQVIEL